MISNAKPIVGKFSDDSSRPLKPTLVLHLREKDGTSKPTKILKSNELTKEARSVNGTVGPDGRLEINTRVVWPKDSGPECGIIRWLCKDTSIDGELLAGVEFDNPVGNCNGLYLNKQNFETKPCHAAYIPVFALMREDDFFTNGIDIPKGKCKPSKTYENCYCSRQAEQDQRLKVGNSSKLDVDLIDMTDNPGSWKKLNIRKEEDPLLDFDFVDSDPKNFQSWDYEPKHVKPNSHNGLIPSSDICNEANLHVYGKIKRDFLSDGNDLVKWSKWKDEHKQINSKTPASITRDIESVDVTDHQSSISPRNEGFELLDPVISPTTLAESFYYDTTQLPSESSSPEPDFPSDLSINSLVEVTVNGEPRYGVIRWIGVPPEDKKKRLYAGIEMEEEMFGCTDGSYNGRSYFHCNPKKAYFVNLSHCRRDRRFEDVPPASLDVKPDTVRDSQIIPGSVRPITCNGDIESLCGKYRGIQGHHNSCYLDALLFSMFAFTSVFDALLFRPPNERDITHYLEVQRILREEIVNPLRKNLYVGAGRVMNLRMLLEDLSSVQGLTSEEKDPEEFLTLLVAQILRADPFLKLSSGQDAYHYQLFVEKDEDLALPSVQLLFEQSFLTSDIKLREVPSCLIIQMPRFGKSYKMYPRILPSQLLDVTDVIEDSPRQCIVCGELAEYECKKCFGQCGVGLQSTAFCGNCLETAHSHQRRSNHKWSRLSIPQNFCILKDHCPIPRLYMELFAVVCIETSHYVAFVKCGSGSDAPWCFFDSMADRKGEQNGYNIPEMVPCPNLSYWLSEEGFHSLQEMDERQRPEHAKRLLCDAYMCMYQSPDVMMYR